MSTLQSAGQSVSNVATSYQNTAASVLSGFTQCFTFANLLNPFSLALCNLNAGTNAVAALTTQMQTVLTTVANAVSPILNTSANSATQSTVSEAQAASAIVTPYLAQLNNTASSVTSCMNAAAANASG
jgi:hypothetical protein